MAASDEVQRLKGHSAAGMYDKASDSTTIMQAHSQLYRSALALNNMGVRLLERDCYKQASDTLREATDLIKAVLKRVSFEAEQDIVQMACKRYAQPKPSSKKRNMMMRTLTLEQDVTICKCGELGTNALQSVLEDIPSSNVAFPVLIEDESLLEKSSAASWVWGNQSNEDKMIVTLYAHAAAVFQNAAVACLCCQQTNRALRLIRIARQIVRHEQVGCLALSLVVLNTTIQSLNVCGHHSDAIERYNEVVEMRSLADSDVYRDHWEGVMYPVAAAAA